MKGVSNGRQERGIYRPGEHGAPDGPEPDQGRLLADRLRHRRDLRGGGRDGRGQPRLLGPGGGPEGACGSHYGA